MRVSEVMSKPVRTIGPADSAQLAFDRMQMHGIHHLVVVRDHQLLGVVTDRDLGSRQGSEMRDGRTVHDLMTPGVVTITPHATVRDAANAMRSRSAGCLPVIEDDRLVGIVTVRDLLDILGRGVDRPAAGERVVMKGRGPRLRAQSQAKLANRAKTKGSARRPPTSPGRRTR
jgi:acetoin utilization protein AcuB